MSNEKNISLSQEEVDRLLGQTTVKPPPRPTIVYKRETIASEKEIEIFDELLKNYTSLLKEHFNEVFSEQGIRKFTPNPTEQMSRLEFMSNVSKNDFIFLIEIDDFEILVKLDSFLFCALSGISFNINHKTNLFQNEVIRTVIAPIILKSLLKASGKQHEVTSLKINPLYDLPLEGLKTETPGISASFTWNEGFKSLGNEKFFFNKDFLNFLIK